MPGDKKTFELNAGTTAEPRLRRELGLVQATALAITDMVGIGPYITIPLFLATMGGPQAMLGWFVGAAVAFSDGLVWAELGAALIVWMTPDFPARTAVAPAVLLSNASPGSAVLGSPLADKTFQKLDLSGVIHVVHNYARDHPAGLLA